MQNQIRQIDCNTLALYLIEVREAVVALIRDLKLGEFDDWSSEFALGKRLALIVDNLCVCWHRKAVVLDQLVDLESSDYQKMYDAIPNWGGSFSLVDHSGRKEQLDSYIVGRDKLLAETIDRYLRNAETIIDEMLREVENNTLDQSNIKALSDKFEGILHALCLAYHLRYLNPNEASSLDPAIVKDLQGYLQFVDTNARLVDV